SIIYDWSQKLANAGTPEEFYEYVVDFYKNFGIGMFALNKAFRLGTNSIVSVANENVGDVKLNDIIGYEIQKQELKSNTEAFLAGLPANNVLLYGDGGTGKSTSVKALLNEYFSQGLRVIEIYKHQFREILNLTETLRKRNYKFIIFIDDLSFEEDESEYKYLKAVIEGGIETRPDNVLIYATSNRRHIIREIWSDRDDMEHNGDIHRSDTVEEKLSLASRFGIAINYSAPTRKEYHEIVSALAEKSGLKINSDELIAGADRWEIRHGGMSGRAARQFIDYKLGIN
ncbi:MAG: ATP-binding protein, partial [Synergistales bacterium]|nr:ATP-binding protein [Synergistales bacterium]MDY6433985.1 ATP-binding protein [Synergistales bacterium]